jgi:hypothetical protein
VEHRVKRPLAPLIEAAMTGFLVRSQET